MHNKRLKYIALMGVLGGLGLTACGEKKENATTSAGGGGDKKIAVKTPEGGDDPAPVPGGFEEVAKATGFAKFLPKSTHAYIGVFDGEGFVDGLRKSKLAKLIEKQAADVGGIDLDELGENPDAKMVFSLFAEEIVLAVGKGAPEQVANLVSINESVSRNMMKFMVKMGEAQVTGEEPDGPGGFGGPESMSAVLGALLGDPSAGLVALEKTQIPPLTIGFKVSDEDIRGQLLEMAAGGLMQLLEQIGPDGQDIAEAVNVTRGDSKFTGLKIIGKKVAGLITDEVREGMAEVMDAASVEKLIKALQTKSVVIAVGVHEDYLIGFAGTDAEELQIAASPAESVLARPEMNFMKSYADKNLLLVASTSKELQEGISKKTTFLGSVVTGLREGLADTEGFGDTRDLEVLLGLIAEQERALFDMYSYKPGGMVVFLEDGLKIESHGGSNHADYDFDTPRKYASVGMEKDIFLFANWVQSAEYSEKVFEYLDSIGETIYLGAKHVTTMKLPGGGDLDQFKEGFGMFDEKIRPHLLDLWGALRGDLAGGLGDEGALIIDLKGEFPTVPVLPQLVVDKGKAPRITLLAPATDHEKLKSSWKRIDTAMRGLLKVVSELADNNIPMQKPMSSEKNDLKTWFFPFPFQTDDFVLSVSVDKKNFFASTSKSFVQDLSVNLEEAEVDESQKGIYFNMDLTLLYAYVNDWIKLVENNAGEIFGEESPAAEDFKEALPMVREVIGAIGELKGIRSHTRKVNGEMRTSVHFKTGG
jgi:hypothetical protein